MKRRRASQMRRREKFVMIAGSVMVLTAVSAAGVTVYQNSQSVPQEENILDFSVLEEEDSAQTQNREVENYTSKNDIGELDYDPYYVQQDALLNDSQQDTAQNSSPAAEEGLQAESMPEPNEVTQQAENVGYAEYDTVNGNAVARKETERTAAESEGESQTQTAEEVALEAVANAMQEERNLHFDENTDLNWPVVGNVLLNYSMDKTVYFQTLQQYKYNPAIVIGAVQGTNIACAADGIVKAVYNDPQTGMTVVMNLGNGYELTYGQLTDVSVEEGELVESGVYIGKVAAPTKYYAKEGTNVYLKLTKEQEPVNPLDFLG